MTADDLPTGEMKYSFKTRVAIEGYAGDLIISSTTVNDLVKSIRLLEHAGITPTTATPGHTTNGPRCPIHPNRELKQSQKPGTLFCSAKEGDGYCTYKVKV